jgi:hypothetical protein
MECLGGATNHYYEVSADHVNKSLLPGHAGRQINYLLGSTRERGAWNFSSCEASVYLKGQVAAENDPSQFRPWEFIWTS